MSSDHMPFKVHATFYTPKKMKFCALAIIEIETILFSNSSTVTINLR
jgi:hypothetical protein